uniref:RNA helicase n=1 Tax=Clastoptera arizonana TaxID=38151 RepID=A0A1B6CXC3_9HEMI
MAQNQQNGGINRPRKRIYINQNLFKNPLEKVPGYDDKGCKLCNLTFENLEQKQNHLMEEIHLVRVTYHNNKNDLLKKIDGLKILVNGVLVEYNGRAEISIRENKVQESEVVLSNQIQSPLMLSKFFKLCQLKEVNVPQAEKNLELIIEQETSVHLKMTAQFHNLGAYLIPLVFKIKDGPEESDSKLLLKEVIYRTQSELMDKLAPLSPYKPLLRNISVEMAGTLVRYRKRSSVKNIFPIPIKLKQLVNANAIKKKGNEPSDDNEEWNKKMDLLKATLTDRNYDTKFQLLLHLEELQSEYEMLKYTINDDIVHFLQNGFFELQVPGLAEKRPSVLKGDIVYITIEGCEEYRFEGLVLRVLQESVEIDLPKKFQTLYRSGNKVTVHFTVNRFALEFYHKAVTEVVQCKATSILFPTLVENSFKLTKKLSPWRNKKIENNVEQQQAVTHIVNKTAFPSPYLIFGPPGTGKTVTLVEAIAQVWLLNPQKIDKQLVCSPTNSTADLLTVRILAAIPSVKIFRLYALSTDINKKHPDLPDKYCNIDRKEFYIPGSKELKEYDIIITTLVTAGRLTVLKPGWFSYLYIDECGQALEPEALIPVAGLLVCKKTPGQVYGQLILAGDPKQLGPIIQSPLSKSYGLELSLLERLMETSDLYKKHPSTKEYNKRYLTKLKKNFRSHEQILSVPNDLFYDKDLKSEGHSSLIERGIGWNKLPNKKFPLIFHGVVGIDERECSSPSYFNRQEIDRVIIYVENLLTNKLNGLRVKQEDLGIITPYSKQVQKISLALKTKSWNKVKVGTVEQFQGDERLIIIISTVRSSQEILEYDLKFKLGFLTNPKRFNVAVTRAKAILILIGNPNILNQDIHWKELIKFIHENGGTIGEGITR